MGEAKRRGMVGPENAQKLPPGHPAELASEDDRQWFLEHPDRNFRVRPYVSGEMPMDPIARPNWGQYVAVRQVVPGVRVRMVFMAEGQPNTGENGAARLFAMCLEGNR
jgi:hypothetical protein